MYIRLPGFIVQLRSLEDHSPLPGVTLGDIGGKFGSGAYNSMDNGVLRFDHVRIPRDQMLMRFVYRTILPSYVALLLSVITLLKLDMVALISGFHKLLGRGNMYTQMFQSSFFTGQWFLFVSQLWQMLLRLCPVLFALL